MKILGIMELDERNRVSYPQKLLNMLGTSFKFVEISTSDKSFIALTDFNDDAGKVIATLNLKSERRGVIPKKVREKLDVNFEKNRYLIILTKEIKNKTYPVLMKLDAEKFLGD